MASGGYRKPAQPAAASGPGALSQRTDGGPAQAAKQLPGAKYGEAAQWQSLQRGAPAAADPGPQAPPQSAQNAAMTSPPPGADQVVPLNAPTQRPYEPVTSGADSGPGPNSASLGLNPNGDAVAHLKQALPPWR